MLSQLLVIALAAVNVLASVHEPRDVISPPILHPGGSDTWTPLQVETVQWVTTGLNLTGLTGTILLGHMQANGTAVLYTDQPLATNVSLEDGQYNVRCPSGLPTSTRYVVALLGAEDNLSPIFLIDNSTTDLLNSEPSSWPAAFTTLTNDNVPSATVTRTDVVGTILPTTQSLPQAVQTNGCRGRKDVWVAYLAGTAGAFGVLVMLAI